MAENNNRVISLVTKFYNQDSELYQSKCDYPLNKSEVNFRACPILEEACKLAVPYKLNVDHVLTVNINLCPTRFDVFPKEFQNIENFCRNCKIKHRERGSN